MVYEGTYEAERIIIRDSEDIQHWIMLSKAVDEPKFCVTCCEDEDWIWEFNYDKYTYESAKYTIMYLAQFCRDIDDLIEELNDRFEQFFDDVVVRDDGSCCGNLAHCGCEYCGSCEYCDECDEYEEE